MMESNGSMILNVVWALLGVVFVVFVVPMLRRKVGPDNLRTGFDIASWAVQAVEQLAPILGIKGEDKFNEALVRAKELAAKAGLKLTDDEWETFIEKCVFDLNWLKGELTKPDPEATTAQDAPDGA